MAPIKYFICGLFGTIFLLNIIACGKKNPELVTIHYIDRVAQDSSFRLGKWCSVSDGAGFHFTSNPLLDTIWFVGDSLAGWSNWGVSPYLFRPTYFSGPDSIVYVTPDPFITGTLDTSYHECGMTQTGDTFIIFWVTSNYQVFGEHYVKLKN